MDFNGFHSYVKLPDEKIILTPHNKAFENHNCIPSNPHEIPSNPLWDPIPIKSPLNPHEIAAQRLDVSWDRNSHLGPVHILGSHPRREHRGKNTDQGQTQEVPGAGSEPWKIHRMFFFTQKKLTRPSSLPIFRSFVKLPEAHAPFDTWRTGWRHPWPTPGGPTPLALLRWETQKNDQKSRNMW